MRTEEEYLREAEDAGRFAERAKTDKAKAVWLRIAAGWMSLVRGLSVEREAFESLAGKRATHEGDPQNRQ